MTTVLRPYQESAIGGVFERWQKVRSVCLVAPTGAGKTVIAEGIIRRIIAAGERMAFFAHRRELIKQTAKRLEGAFPGAVGVVMSDEQLAPSKPVQVASIQTCLKRDFWPEASFIILDETHHYVSEDWNEVNARYPNARVVGLTATPERQDGRPLGDLFQDLVVAAHYSELLAEGFLTQCKAFQPNTILKNAVAQAPLKAWQTYARGLGTFAFGSKVKYCERQVEIFKNAGIPSAIVSHKTPKRERDYVLELFDAGKIQVLWSDTALTEGVDIPRAKCALLARMFGHITPYLQACGRVLRPHSSSDTAIVVDLCGATLIHGLPTEDRTYSLDGKGIRRTSVAPLKNCPKCGATILSAYQECPECGYLFQSDRMPKQVKIYDLELRECYAGDATPEDKKLREWQRLLHVSSMRGWGVNWALKEYNKLFADKPDMSIVSWERRLEEWRSLQAYGRARGFKPGWAFYRYQQIFNQRPPREWGQAS